jgi:pimeloyl-ACP methyl ester carboxylesterase
MARARPWGFTIDVLRAPVFIYQGEADLVVPASAARQYQRLIPHAIARYYPGEAHRALWAHVTEIVADLLGQD